MATLFIDLKPGDPDFPSFEAPDSLICDLMSITIDKR
jgi:hypothetical protein